MRALLNLVYTHMFKTTEEITQHFHSILVLLMYYKAASMPL